MLEKDPIARSLTGPAADDTCIPEADLHPQHTLSVTRGSDLCQKDAQMLGHSLLTLGPHTHTGTIVSGNAFLHES